MTCLHRIDSTRKAMHVVRLPVRERQQVLTKNSSAQEFSRLVFNSFVKNPVYFRGLAASCAAFMHALSLCTYFDAALTGQGRLEMGLKRGCPGPRASNQSAIVAIPCLKGAFSMSAVKFWAVFAVGVAAGASVALIYAPQSGIKTRRQLRRGLEDASDYVRNTADAISDCAEKYVKRGKDMAENVMDTASSAYGAARKVVPM